MRKQHQDHAARHRGVGNIKNGPARELITEEIDVEEIRIDEIDDLSIKERRIAEEQAVEYTIEIGRAHV